MLVSCCVELEFAFFVCVSVFTFLGVHLPNCIIQEMNKLVWDVLMEEIKTF